MSSHECRDCGHIGDEEFQDCRYIGEEEMLECVKQDMKEQAMELIDHYCEAYSDASDLGTYPLAIVVLGRPGGSYTTMSDKIVSRKCVADMMDTAARSMRQP
jgi:hypothetical protein